MNRVISSIVLLFAVFTINAQNFWCTYTWMGDTIPSDTTEVLCGCDDLAFDTYTNNQIARISVGSLTSTSCAITGYAIEWYYNGGLTPEFITGNAGNTDPNIAFVHPLTGDNQLVVAEGTWQPKIKYIIINDTTIYNNPSEGAPWCELIGLTVLPEITVLQLDCSLSNISGDYSYQVNYNGTNPNPSLASRSFNYYIGSTTNYFAFEYTGYTVSDRIKISYVDISDEESPVQLCDFVVGQDNTSTNYSVSPVAIDQYAGFNYVIDVSSFPYTTGNYLLIEISPSYNQPTNTNTNWLLKTKCLDTFDCTTCDPIVFDIDPYETQLLYDEVNCVYVLRTRNVGECVLTDNFHTYLENINTTSNQNSYTGLDFRSASMTLDFLENTDATLPYSKQPISTCVNLTGTLTLAKVSNVVTFSFTHEADYLLYKNEFVSALGGANITNYDSDNTTINHYKYIFGNIRIGVNCGDNWTTKSISYHPSGNIDYNDAGYVITLTLATITNGLTDSECNDTYETAETVRSSILSRYSEADYSVTTGCKNLSAIGAQYLAYSAVSEKDQTGFTRNELHTVNADSICGTLTDKGYCLSGTTFPLGNLYLHNQRILFTGTGDYESRVDNFRIYDLRDENRCLDAAGTVVYEVSGGTVTTPAVPDSPTLLRNLLACYEFNGNKNDSRNIYGGSWSTGGIVSYGTGVIKQAAYFPPARIYNSSQRSMLNSNGQYTVATWFNANNTTGTKTLGGVRATSGAQILVKLVGNKIGLYMTDTKLNADTCLSTTSVSGGTWYHVAIVRDGYDIKLYLNGTLDTSITSTNLGRFVINNGYAGFGAIPNTTSEYYSGYIEQFTTWSRALCVGEISALYNSGNGLDYNDFNTITCP